MLHNRIESSYLLSKWAYIYYRNMSIKQLAVSGTSMSSFFGVTAAGLALFSTGLLMGVLFGVQRTFPVAAGTGVIEMSCAAFCGVACCCTVMAT